MENFNVYEDISRRTNGDIYIGVVGPVRCGKSTFITSFMNSFVLPNITNKFSRERAKDELPQSADGKTIMTTQPKFIPNEAVKVQFGSAVELNLRMIDCVGYMIDGALGGEEDEKPRLVKTPWSENEMPFNEAAEIGTTKVMTEHSTIAILMTTDGSVTDIERKSYIEAEDKIAQKLNELNKPYVIVVNSANPNSKETRALCESLSEKYGAPAISLNAKNLREDDVVKIFENILTQFPLKSVKVKMPDWLQALNYENPLIQSVIDEVVSLTGDVLKMGDFSGEKIGFSESDDFEPLVIKHIKMGEGKLVFEVVPKPRLFYKVLSDECGENIESDYHLVSYLKQLTYAKREFDKLKTALDEVEETGYGVVYPHLEEMKLEEPEIVKQGGRSGVRLKASAPSLHIMKVDIETEINPVVGTEQQSEELVKYLLSEFENNPQGIWQTNMFGKSLHMLVKEGLSNKLTQMPQEVQKKMRKTLSRVVNEGKGGIICILL